MTDKQCSKCERILPATQFYLDKTGTDGLRADCKDCRSQYWRSNSGKAAKNRYEFKGEAKILKTARKKKYPNRHRARKAVQGRVARGTMPAATSLTCACGKPAAEYHHHNGYDNWFDVLAVCQDCHGIAHRVA